MPGRKHARWCMAKCRLPPCNSVTYSRRSLSDSLRSLRCSPSNALRYIVRRCYVRETYHNYLFLLPRQQPALQQVLVETVGAVPHCQRGGDRSAADDIVLRGRDFLFLPSAGRDRSTPAGSPGGGESIPLSPHMLASMWTARGSYIVSTRNEYKNSR